jgi:hypothetical protein
MNWQQFKEALVEEGIDTTEACYIGWALDQMHVLCVHVSTDNSAYSGWKLGKDDDGKFGMEKIP